MSRLVFHVAAAAAALTLFIWTACGPGKPSFDDGEDPGSGVWAPSSCCCMRNIVIMAASEGAACPDGYTEAPPDRCPGGQDYPNDACDINWNDPGPGDAGPESGGGDDVADAGPDDAGFDAGAGFCCCSGPDVANPLDIDGGLSCPDGFNKLTPDLCPGGPNYPNGLCGA